MKIQIKTTTTEINEVEVPKYFKKGNYTFFKVVNEKMLLRVKNYPEETFGLDIYNSIDQVGVDMVSMSGPEETTEAEFCHHLNQCMVYLKSL